MAIKALFSKAAIRVRLEKYLEGVMRAAIDNFRYVGEGFIADCRNLRTYQDQTGNLRSSCGYMIIYNGKIIENIFEAGSQDEGKGVGEAYAKKIASQFKGKRLVLIGVAGMEYATAVESRGYDVITGSSEMAKNLLRRQLEKITKKVNA